MIRKIANSIRIIRDIWVESETMLDDFWEQHKTFYKFYRLISIVISIVCFSLAAITAVCLIIMILCRR